MPFEQCAPRPFMSVSVLANAPTASGVYGISNAREWIYIGETDNIQASLLLALQQSDSAVLKKHPTGFVFEVCDPIDRLARHNRLIMEYESVCNRRLLGNDVNGAP